MLIAGTLALARGIISAMLYTYLVINLLTFILWGVDKFRAQAGRWRISERTLLSLAWLGGAGGALAGMLIFHHKTRKGRFWLWVLAACAAHLALWIAVRR